MKVNAFAAETEKGELKPYSYELGPLGENQVDIKIESCGICHSDISMLDNDWGFSQYPFVGGHEIVGIIESKGNQVNHLSVGQRVGLGWFTGSCMTCQSCMSGDHNLCQSSEQTIVGRYGGFADKVRSNAEWVIPLPESLDAKSAGPLFCGGITVFNPIIQFEVRPTHRVGVIGIGGLGHMALAFLNAWGCEVTAFSNSPDKEAEAKKLGAHHFIASVNKKALRKAAGSLDMIISTVNVSLDWSAYIDILKPRGRLHFVGAVLEPIQVGVFSLLGGQKSVSASPLGSPATIRQMLDFASLHNISPQIEEYKFGNINEAIEKVRNGRPRYRVVLQH